MRRAALGLLLGMVGSNAADASCLRTCGCEVPSDWVVEGTVEQSNVPSDGGALTSRLRVDRVFAAADASSPAVGDLLETGGGVGDVFLVASGAVGVRVTDAGITCSNVRFTVEEYAAMLRDGGCESTMRAKGFVEPPCRDFRFGCGCSSAGPLLGALSLAALAFGRRAPRRRS